MEDSPTTRNSNPDDTNLARQKLTKIKLADGKEYNLTPVNLNILVAMEDEFNMSLKEVMADGRVAPIRYLLFLQLKDQYGFSLEEVGNLVDLDVLNSMQNIIGVKSG